MIGSSRPDPSQIRIRPLQTLEEYRACVRLQEETWGQGFSERVPVSILKVSQRLGGVVSGAFGPDGELLGFVYGMTGWSGEEPFHWSDMLAVRASHRGLGIGRALKLHQREILLPLGVRRMHWTFDPLEPGNAFLNFRKLGAWSREYVEDMYGESNSPLHSGLGTDRFVVTWSLDSPRTARRIGEGVPGASAAAAGTELPGGEEAVRAFSVDMGGPKPGPTGPLAPPDPPRPFIIPVPSRVQELKDRDPELGWKWRRFTRSAFQSALAEGYAVVEVYPGPEVSHYLLLWNWSEDREEP